MISDTEKWTWHDETKLQKNLLGKVRKEVHLMNNI